MAKERDLLDEQILQFLIEQRMEYAQSVARVEKITVNEEYCMPVGIFSYRVNGQKMISRLFLISEIREEGMVNIIYNEKGKVIAYQEEAEDMEWFLAGDVRLDRNVLKRQLVLAEERARNGEPAPGEEEPKKSGGGRSLEDKEHEKKLAQEEQEKAQEKKKQEEEEQKRREEEEKKKKEEEEQKRKEEEEKKKKEEEEEKKKKEEEEQKRKEEEEQKQKEEEENKDKDKEDEQDKAEEQVEKEKDKAEEQADKKDEQDKKGKDEQETKKLKNLRYKISTEGSPKIKLQEIINGYYLWEILQIESKLKGRLPAEIDATSFRTGYLSIVDSHDLETRDGKTRPSQDTFVIETLNGDIIELDSNILKSKSLGTREERKVAEQSRLRFENGEEAVKPDFRSETTRTSLYQIPEVSDKFNVAENWYLAVDNDVEWMRRNKTSLSGNRKNISFVQVSKNELYHNREEIIQNTLEYKLKSINEPRVMPGKEKQEEKQQKQIIEKSPTEAEDVRREHKEEIVEECFIKYPSLAEIYNRNDISKKVEEYHNQGLSDKEVIEKIGEVSRIAEETEHPQYMPERKNRPKKQ